MSLCRIRLWSGGGFLMPTTPLSIHKMRQTADTIGHWTFSEGAGDTLADASGSGRTGTRGTAPKTPTWVTTGRHKWALSFDGTDDQVTIPSVAALTPANLSLLAWVNPAGNLSYPMFISKWGAASGYELRMHAFDKTAELVINDAIVATDTVAMVVGTWYFLVGTYDQTNLRIYKNGAQVGSAAYAVALASNTNALTFGDRPAGGQPYQGLLDNVQIRSVAMTAAEIAAEFQRLTRVVLVG